MKISYRDEIEHYINTLTDDALINMIQRAFVKEAQGISAKQMIFYDEGNELSQLTSAVLNTTLESIDEFIEEKVTDSEKLDRSLFVVSINKIQSIIDDMEFNADGVASSINLFEAPKEEIEKTIAKEKILGNKNILYPDVENSYIASVKDNEDDTLVINIYASQFMIKPNKFIMTEEDEDYALDLCDMHNSEYEYIDCNIYADNKETSLESIDKSIEKEKEEIVTKLAQHLGNLFGKLGITSNIKVKHIAARIAMLDTINLKQKILNFDDEAIKEVIKHTQLLYITKDIIQNIRMNEDFRYEKEYMSLNAMTATHTKSKYNIQANRTYTGEISIRLFMKGYTEEEIKEIFSKVKKHYAEYEINNKSKAYSITYVIESNIVEV